MNFKEKKMASGEEGGGEEFVKKENVDKCGVYLEMKEKQVGNDEKSA